MKTIVKITAEIDIKTLEVNVLIDEMSSSYELTTVHKDIKKALPFRDGDLWHPIINLDEGIIKNWPSYIKASIKLKTFANGLYNLRDEKKQLIKSIKLDYVPHIFRPNDRGIDDFIIMEVDFRGKITNWITDIADFFPED